MEKARAARARARRKGPASFRAMGWKNAGDAYNARRKRERVAA
jgi:hypothetical protein